MRREPLRCVIPGLLFVAIGALWAWRTRSLLTAENDALRWGMRDFRDGVYYPVVAWLDGVNPYSPAQFLEAYPQVEQLFPLVSPGVLVLNLPFAALPYPAAMVAFFLVSLALLTVFATVLLKAAGARITPARILWLAVFLVASRPAYAALTLGQGILPVAIGVTLALAWARSNPVVGGLGLSLAILKPTFGAPLALLLLARRDYRAFWVGLGIAFATAIVPLATIVAGVGVEGFAAGIGETLAQWGAHPAVGLSGEDVGRFDASAALVRLLGLPIAEVNSLPVALGILGIAAWALRTLTAPVRDAGQPGDRDVTEPLSSLVILLAVLLSVYHQRYDAIVLAMPIAVLFWRGVPGLAETTSRWLLVLFVGVWFNYLATVSAVWRLGLTPWEWPWRVVASLNSVALLIAFGVVVRAAFVGREPA